MLPWRTVSILSGRSGLPRALWAFAAAGALLLACRADDRSRGAAAPQTIDQVRLLPADAPRPAPRVVTSAERFGYAQAPPPPAPAAPAAPVAPVAADGLIWTAPAGWREAPARPMRLVTFWPAADAKSECYVARLGGQGGGVAANINRWRGQMNQPPLDDPALAGLAKIEVLGQPAPLVEIEGEYAAMGTAPAQPGYALLGTVAPLGEQTIFVKLIGPVADVKAQRGRFIEFCRSLRAAPAPAE
jgi:hypothetical protein